MGAVTNPLRFRPIQKQDEQKPAEPISLKKATPVDKAPIEKTKVRISNLQKIPVKENAIFAHSLTASSGSNGSF